MRLRLSIYLVKTIANDINQILKLERINNPIELKLDGADALLYIKQHYEPQIPEWATLFLSAQPDLHADVFGKNSSAGAILFIAYKEERFLLSFGTGHHLINDNYIVREFGLKVTLNSISQKKIRSIDKGNHNEINLLTRSQSTKEVDIYNLKIDSELDILTTLTGICTENILGDRVTGRDALVINPDISFNSIPGLLDKIIEVYGKPLPNEFEWVNNIKQADDDEIEILDMELLDAIKLGDFSDILLGEPEIVDWERQIGYCFERWKKSPIYPVVALEHFIEHCKTNDIDVTLDVIKNKNIHVINEQYETVKTWSIYRCLYAEIKNGDRSYVLRNGMWYCADRDFLAIIDNEINKINTYEDSSVMPIYSFENEEDYIKNLCRNDKRFTLMDQNFIYHGGGHSKVEFCDVIRDQDTLVHIKYYTGSQSMSHLFSQAYVSGEFFVSDAEFRKKLNDKLPKSFNIDYNCRPDTRMYKIVFAIATKSELPSGLPIFSKINLKNFHRRLTNLGYQVSICKIPIDSLIYRKKTYRPKSKL